MTKIYKLDITLIENLTINIGLISVSVIGIIFLIIKNPTRFENILAKVHNKLKRFFSDSEYFFVKYNLQSKLNKYVDNARKKAPQIESIRAKIQWVDEQITRETFLLNGELVIKLEKSDNQNRNLVNATMAFITCGYLKKAKSYISNSQRDAIDLFVCYDILKEQKNEILNQFVQDYLKIGLSNDKISDFFNKFMDIDKAGLFFPVFIQELTFFGEKVFTQKKDANKIYDQIKILSNYLYNYSHRKLSEDIINDYNGTYSKFAIRIIGKSIKINKEGENVYKKNLEKLDNDIETLYLIGNLKNKDFIKNVAVQCDKLIGFYILYEKEYTSTIKDGEGNDMNVETFLVVLRNLKIQTVHKK